jgi:helicase
VSTRLTLLREYVAGLDALAQWARRLGRTAGIDDLLDAVIGLSVAESVRANFTQFAADRGAELGNLDLRMAFKGLFIGIDRYASAEINWLSCARRDATALHALFTDTLGGETRLLTDGEATVAAIYDSFEQLAATGPDDVVVIAFSGHGTEHHELVAYDTNRYELESTTVPLTTLSEWCGRIPSRRLLIVLDCCFSGGMGAKALQVEGVARDIQSVEGKLNQMSGQGRVILTASGPAQRAWESSRLGHGFLTLHLLEALQGPEEIREGERIGVLRLLDYVVRRVADAARLIRREQHPTVRGTFDGEFTWPVFFPGRDLPGGLPRARRTGGHSGHRQPCKFRFPGGRDPGLGGRHPGA